MARFNAGDRVRIRSWESMEKEFGLAATGSVNCSRRFTSLMKTLCGETATIRKIWGNGDIELGDWSCENMDVDWQFSVDMIEPTSNATSIHITTDGKTTHAVLKDGGKVSKRAKAVCSPDDEFDFATGARIAFDRLMGTEATGTVREVKREAKVGDWVYLTKEPRNMFKCAYHKGDIVKITHFGIMPSVKSIDGINITGFYGDEYVVLEGYTPPKEPEKPKYYNGKVVCVDDCGYPDTWTKGRIYVFVDGVTTSDKGWKTSCYKTLEHANGEKGGVWVGAKFIEFKGEA